jgi:alkylated DNA nucleotide flippase Atl1
MGYNEMDKVYKHSKAKRIDKFVLLTIAKTYNVGQGSWPPQEKIALLTGIPDARGVRRSLQRLSDLGELIWVRGSNKSGKANVYFIPFLESRQADLTGDVKTKMTAENDQNDLSTSDQNDPLLNKRLNKRLDKENSAISELCLSEEIRLWAESKNPGVDVDFVFDKFLLHPSHAHTDFLNKFKLWLLNERIEPKGTKGKDDDNDDWRTRAIND